MLVVANGWLEYGNAQLFLGSAMGGLSSLCEKKCQRPGSDWAGKHPRTRMETAPCFFLAWRETISSLLQGTRRSAQVTCFPSQKRFRCKGGVGGLGWGEVASALKL